jgi:hypothetical protein
VARGAGERGRRPGRGHFTLVNTLQALSLTLKRLKATRGKLVIFATCDQDCTLTVTGKLTVRVGHRLRGYRVRKLVVHLAAGVRTKLKLTLPKKSKRAVVRALRKHRRVTVRLRGAATGANGTSASANLKFSGMRLPQGPRERGASSLAPV